VKSLFRNVIFLLFSSVLFVAFAHATPPTQWSSMGIGGGGALFSPSFSPHNPSELYIACDMGELFHSTDLGVGWSVVDFRQLQSFHSSKVEFTSDPNILYSIDYTYAGTNAARPTKSTDGGASWVAAASWPASRRAFNLYADPASTSRLIVTTATDLYFSSDGGNAFTSKYSDATGKGLSIGGVFFDGQAIYAGINAGLLISSDGGSTFTLASVGGIPSTEAIFSFAGAKQGGITRFLAVTVDATKVVASGQTDPIWSESVYGSYRNVYSLDWGQPNWTLKNSGIASGDQPVLVAMAAGNVSMAYLAGQIAPIGTARAGSAPVVYKTVNGGASWQSVFFTSNNQNIYTGWTGQGGDNGSGNWWWGNTPLGLAVAPNDPNKLVTTDKGGVPHLSTDGGANWHQIYTDATVLHSEGSPTPTRQYYQGVGMEPTASLWLFWQDASNLFAGYADISMIRSKDAGKFWAFDWSGLQMLGVNGYYNYSTEVYHMLRHPVSGSLYAAQSNGMGAIYQAIGLTDGSIDSVTGAVRSSVDSGYTWATLHDFGHPVVWLAVDPNNSNRMYASVVNSTQGGIYRTSDLQNGAASQWAKLPNPPRTEGHPFNIQVLSDGTLVTTFSGRIGANGLFTQSSGVFVSSDGGSTWSDRSDPAMLYYTKNMALDPGDTTQSTWYVSTFSNWGGNNQRGGLFRTTNRGLSWSKIFTAYDVESVTVNPVDPNEIYLGTKSNGLWHSSNARDATPSFDEVTSYPFRQPTRIFFNPYNANEIWVTSDGNGLHVGLTVGKASQSISFLAYTPTVAIGGTGTISAMATSGLAVSFTSTTPSVCTVSGSTVTGVAAGTCTIAANQGGNANYNPSTQVTQNISVAIASYTGLWWNSNEPGWGMSLTQHGSTIANAMYTYDQNGQPTWYTMACPLTGVSCTGDIYKVSGGTPPTVPWNGSGKVTSSAGSGTLTFADANTGTFIYTINDLPGSKSVSRLVFATGTTPPAVDYTDLWWNQNESGWGVALTQQYGIASAAWYSYDSTGKAVWYVGTCTVSGSGCTTSDLYQFTGGAPLTSVWHGTNPSTKVGTISFAFTDANNGTMSYTINGVPGSSIIKRLSF